MSKHTKHKFTNYYNIYNEIDNCKIMFDQLKDKKFNRIWISEKYKWIYDNKINNM